jgi:hypothetical protein
MSQIEVGKLNQFVYVAPPEDSISASKLTMFVWMMPGDDGSAVTPNRQAHVYAQKIRRR